MQVMKSGATALKNAEASASRAKPVTDKMVPLAQKAAPGVPVPTDGVTLVRINAAAQLTAAAALATGRMPRLASTVLVMGIVAVFVFLLLHLSPGDPAAIIAGDNASNEQIAGIRRQLGLDDALPVQFFRWLAAVLQGDLGISIFSNVPVLKLISQRVEPTLSLALVHKVIAFYLENADEVDRYVSREAEAMAKQRASAPPGVSLQELRRRLRVARAG